MGWRGTGRLPDGRAAVPARRRRARRVARRAAAALRSRRHRSASFQACARGRVGVVRRQPADPARARTRPSRGAARRRAVRCRGAAGRARAPAVGGAGAGPGDREQGVGAARGRAGAARAALAPGAVHGVRRGGGGDRAGAACAGRVERVRGLHPRRRGAAQLDLPAVAGVLVPRPPRSRRARPVRGRQARLPHRARLGRHDQPSADHRRVAAA